MILCALRRSSNGEDAAPSSAEMAVQFRPRRSTVRSLIIRRVAPVAVARLITDEHYLHSMPTAPIACFGVYLNSELVGAVVITSGARHSHRVLSGGTSGTVATLARLWLADSVPKNSESRVLAVVANQLRRDTSMRALLSYADPLAGHVGTVYQAAGWQYLGIGQPGRYIDLGDGRLHHPRSVTSKYETNSPSQLRAKGIEAKSVTVPGKHRYCLLLDSSWSWRLSQANEPYPKVQTKAS